jgi:hypothetical protein
MFTLKLYTHGGSRRILEAESFHIYTGHDDCWFEISAYFAKPADDPDNAKRFDIGPSPYEPSGGRWDYAFIENAAGRTTEKLWPVPQRVEEETAPVSEDDKVKRMVDRFLAWRLPDDFRPDCGIHFDADAAKKLNPQNGRYDPTGTNLLDATQAEAMIRHILNGQT